MRILILGSGQGTRLRPITYSQPKCLIPIANKPAIGWIIDRLISGLGRQIDEIIITVNWQFHSDLEQFIGDRITGIPVKCIAIRSPKGSLGDSRAAREWINLGANEPLLIIYGDTLIDYDFSGFIKESSQHNNISILLGDYVEENVSDYGIAVVDHRSGAISSFYEKPKCFSVVNIQSRAIIGASLGVYYFPGSVFDLLIGSADGISVTNDLSQLISDIICGDHAWPQTIRGFKCKANWIDIGTIYKLLAANEYYTRTHGNQSYRANQFGPQVDIIKPTIIDPSAHLINCTVGPFASIGPDVYIGNANISHSIVEDGAIITGSGDQVINLSNSFIGKNSVILNRQGKLSSLIVGNDSIIA